MDVPAEIFNPRTERWTTVSMMSVPRLYHATAILLPDGRVLTAGTDEMWNPDPFHEAELRLEIFSPPICSEEHDRRSQTLRLPPATVLR
jgi:hypothetical protein